LTPRGGFGLYLKRKLGRNLSLDDLERIIGHLCETLASAGLLTRSTRAGKHDDPPVTYQLAASSMVWKVGTGLHAFHDPIRVPHLPEGGGRTNPFFIRLYRAGPSRLAQ